MPFGDGNQEIIKELKARGFLCNFGKASGLNNPEEDIFQLRRIAALDYALPEFIFNVSGAEMQLRQFWKGKNG